MTMNLKQMGSTLGAALFTLGATAGLGAVAVMPAKASEAYIQQAHGNVAAGATILTKPTPETAAPAGTQPAQAGAAPAATAPVTCNAQNASSSQACYTATQQARPASK